MSDPGDVRRIFDQAIEVAPAERGPLLDRLCADRPSLRQEVERLLTAYERFGDIFDADESDSGEPGEFPAVGHGVPAVVGAYRIERQIGEGGAGAVYLATRDDDEFTKTVAVKLLRPGLTSAELVRRFRNERQILAAIDHPYIAKLLDGGSTADGLPFVVMEYIDGLPIDTYCEQHQLSVGDRLRLFCKVCAAVQFAHQNLVIHRDIKPANILVTADGTPKLLDFGIAKLVNPQALARSLDVTSADSRPMTPEYASPEQIRGEPITTASDVYLLGVLLYRILTGQRPYRPRTEELVDLAAAICHQDPVPPSEAGGHHRSLEGDLDNIVLKAMRKEPARRYGSAQELADDVERHLANLPVRARADSVRYRTVKFVRRHRIGVAAAAAFLLIVVAAATGLSVQAVRIAEQRDRAEAQRARAERETAKARAINDFLLRTLGAANPQSGTGREVTLVAALETAASTARHALAADPEVEAGVLNVVGMTYVELGRYNDAAPLLDRALQLRTKALGNRHVDVAESLESKATLLRWRGQFDEAERLYRDAITIVRAAGGPADRIAWIQQGLGMSLQQRGDDQTALTIFGEALELARSGPVTERTRAELLSSAGVSHRRLEHYDQAEANYREALAIQRRLLGPEHAEIGTLLNNLGVLMNSSGRYAEAELIHRDALKVRQTALGATHPLVANSMLSLAVSLENRGDLSGAGVLYDQAARIVRAALGPDHPRLAQVLRNWGVMLGNQRRFTEAVPLLREALRIRRTAFKEDSRDVADALDALATALRRAGSFQESETLTRRALTINISTLGPDTAAVAVSRQNLGALLCSTGKVTDGLELLTEAAAFFTRHPTVEPKSGAVVRGEYGSCLIKAGRFAQAEAELLAAHGQMSKLGPNHPSARESAARLATLYTAWGKPGEASKFAAPPTALHQP